VASEINPSGKVLRDLPELLCNFKMQFCGPAAENWLCRWHGAGVVQYWSAGVLGIIQTEAFKSYFRQHGDMIICSVKVIRQKQIQTSARKSM